MNLKYLRRLVFKIFKRNKWIFYWFEWLKWHKEIDCHKKNNSECYKSKERIKYEENLVRKYWRIGTFHYYRYGLQFKNLSDQQILDYVPTYYHHRNLERCHKNIDTVKYGDKLIQARLFEERFIPSAKVLAIVKNGKCFDLFEQKELVIDEIINEKLSKPSNKLFFKPTGGCGGAGIIVLKKTGNIYIMNGMPISSLSVLKNSLNSSLTYVVQENINQSNQLNSINNSSLNTIRVVAQKEDNKMNVKTCILRMGRAGKEVDNSAQGGISIKIDVETGLLAESATAEHGGGCIYKHPDSGYIFKNNRINNWSIVKEQIEIIASKLIDFDNIALDIAVTEDDVLIIEFNFRYGIEHQQCVLGGVRRILSIYN